MGTGYWVLSTGYWLLGIEYWALGTGQWVLGNGYWVLSNGYWLLGIGYWVLGKGYSLHRRLGGPGAGMDGRGKSRFFPGVRNPDRPAGSVVTIPTELSRPPLCAARNECLYVVCSVEEY